jgi:hypothetical protein
MPLAVSRPCASTEEHTDGTSLQDSEGQLFTFGKNDLRHTHAGEEQLLYHFGPFQDYAKQLGSGNMGIYELNQPGREVWSALSTSAVNEAMLKADEAYKAELEDEKDRKEEEERKAEEARDGDRMAAGGLPSAPTNKKGKGKGKAKESVDLSGWKAIKKPRTTKQKGSLAVGVSLLTNAAAV